MHGLKASQVLYKYSHTEHCHINLTEKCHQLLAHAMSDNAHPHGVNFDSQDLHESE